MILGSVALLQVFCPEFPCRTELGYLFPEVSKDIEVEGEAPDKIVNVMATAQDFLDIGIGNLEGVSDFLNRRTTRFANVITTNADRVGSGEFLHRIFDRITDETYSGFHGKDPCPPSDHLFENIVLRGSAHSIFFKSVFFGGCLEHGQHDACYSVDGEAGANSVEWNALEGDFEVSERINRHTDPSHLTLRQRVIGIEAHLCGKIEGDIETGLAMGDHQFETLVGLFRHSETRILPGGPLPTPVAKGMDSPGVRIFAWKR